MTWSECVTQRPQDKSFCPDSVRSLNVDPGKQSCPEFLRGRLRETANFVSGALTTKQCRKCSHCAGADNWKQGGRFRNRNGNASDIGNLCAGRIVALGGLGSELAHLELIGACDSRKNSKRG